MPSTSKTFTGPLGRALVLGLLVFGTIAFFSFLTAGQTLENKALDLCYQLRPPAPPPPELLIVGIDETSFQEVRRPWPWPRRLHAALIKRLSEAGARLIIFDVLFADPTTPEDDQIFAQAMRRAGNVIVAQTIETLEDPRFSRQILVQPLEMFCQSACGTALFMVFPDADGVVRRFRLYLGSLQTMPALVIRTLRPQDPIPPDLSGLIHFIGPPGSIETISYCQLLDPEQPLPVARIRDRIVLIGRMLETSIDLRAKIDAFYTPFFSKTKQVMSGVELHGQIISTLLRGNWGKELQWGWQLGLSLLILLGFSILIVRLKPPADFVILLGVVALIWAGSVFFFLYLNFWVPPVLLSLGLTMAYGIHVLGYFLTEVREKRWLRHAFARYVSPAVVEVIMASPERLELGGEEVEATVLFADLAGFTALSENISPKELINVLDEYFDAMTQIILSYEGTVDKYIGDAIMCFWGAPVPLADHAVRACRASLEMKETIQNLQIGWRLRGLNPLTIRIGIHSGLVVAGNVGSRQRFNYTVIGDTVNLAHRLEQANKYYGTKIIVSEATFRLTGAPLMMRELDYLLVRGRTQPVIIYELLGYLSEDELPITVKLFGEGLAAYRQGEWHQAANIFQEILRLNPDDAPTRLFLERCQKILQHPPPFDWRGIHNLNGK